MRFIAIVPLWLGLISNCLTAPQQLQNFQQISERSFNFGVNEPMSAPLARGANPEAFENLQAQTEIKDRPQTQFNQQLENNSKESSRLNGPIPGPQIAPLATDFTADFNALPLPKENIDFFSLLKENPQFSAVLKNDANFLQLPKADSNVLSSSKSEANVPTTKEGSNIQPFLKKNVELTSLFKSDPNFFQFLKENTDFLSLPKGDASSPPLPKSAINFPTFPQGNVDFSSPPKGDANSLPLPKGNINFPPFPQGNVDFSSSPKGDANSLPLPKGNINFPPFPQGNTNILPMTKNSPNSAITSDANLVPSLKGNADFFSLPKIDAKSPPLPQVDDNFLSFLRGNADFLALLKNEANQLLLPKGDASILSLPKANENFLSSLKNDANFAGIQIKANLKMSPAAPSQGFPESASQQPNSAPLPEQVKDTPEVSAAREAHLQAVAEIASKLAEPVKETPEVMAAREAHQQAAANHEAAIPTEAPKYTPEVQAAREAHFRAYALAAKLAAESDINPKILEQLLGRPGEPKLGAQNIDGIIESFMTSPKFAEELKRLIAMMNLSMNIEVPETKPEGPKEILPQPTDNRGVNNLMEKPQLKSPIKPAEIVVSTGVPQPSTSLRVTDAKLPALDEFEQFKSKAATDLVCITGLKVKDLKNIKPTEDQSFIIIRTGELTPIDSTLPLPVDQLERWKNWAIQYMSL